MNLNFPNRPPEAVEQVEVTTQGFRDVGEMHAVRRTDLRGREYYWMSFRGQKQEHAEGNTTPDLPHIILPDRESTGDCAGSLRIDDGWGDGIAAQCRRHPDRAVLRLSGWRDGVRRPGKRRRCRPRPASAS